MIPPVEVLVDRVRGFAGQHVWVVGDVMLDEYLEGPVKRISPEAPVPVVRVRDRFTRLGGAANVARAISALGGHAHLCGVVGQDEAGNELAALCRANGIDARALGRDPGRPTTRKLRVLGQGQQLLRMDWEDRAPAADTLVARMLDELDAGPAPAAIALSDYAKGLVSRSLVARVVALGRAHGIPVLADPKQSDVTWYRGATVLKPNLRELEDLVGRPLAGAPDEVLADAARQVLADAEIEKMVLTLGSRGALAVDHQGHEAVPAVVREVFDVTGAGDTVLAVLTLALGAGAELGEAVQLANVAAGIAIAEVGTAAVDTTQLLDGLRPKASSKRVSRASIDERVRGWQRAGKRVVFTNGCFDLLHAGHLYMLQQCAALGDVLVVGVNSDASVKRLKGDERPLVPEHERAALLGALDCVSAVVVFDEDTPLALLEQVRPDVLVKGDDYRLDQVVGRELVESLGGEVRLIPLLPRHSTTKLLERIRGLPREQGSD